jgi:hypothetical protein
MEEKNSPLRPSMFLKGTTLLYKIKALVSEVKDVDC